MDAHGKPFVVIAEFRMRPECRDEFLAIAEADARQSVANEPGCRQFNAMVPEDQPDHLILFEVYDDRAAFELHLQQPHYFPFRDAVPDMTIGERIVRFGALAV